MLRTPKVPPERHWPLVPGKRDVSTSSAAHHGLLPALSHSHLLTRPSWARPLPHPLPHLHHATVHAFSSRVLDFR